MFDTDSSKNIKMLKAIVIFLLLSQKLYSSRKLDRSFICVYLFADDELENLISEVQKASSRGISVLQNASSEPNWTFGQTLFFSTTVVTTIGIHSRYTGVYNIHMVLSIELSTLHNIRNPCILITNANRIWELRSVKWANYFALYMH